jgi:glycosyltransferase EpsJ
MPTLSIIIPVYNAEAYLEKCLSSIIAQSYSDWECICVNDGSTDSSDEILKRFSEKENRINRLCQDNRGSSVARNCGLDVANGQYVLFMDADDFMVSDGLANLANMINQEHLDVFGFSYETYPDGHHSHYSMCTGETMCPNDLLKTTQTPQSSDDFSFAWRYMIRRSLLKKYNITFDSRIRMGEDTLFMMEVFSHAARVHLTEYAPYRYRVNNIHSIMHEKRYKPFLEQSLSTLYQSKCEIIKKNHWDDLTPFSFDLAQRTVKNYVGMLINNRKAKGESKDTYIREVLNLPMVQDAMSIIGYKNIHSNWKEYMIYLCMKFQIIPILKHYF